ncbi:MAG: DNA-binding protein WhiA [Acholeplasmatales bacterium]|nr:DNA-binding protein WhiA [Acholeplasmatales bacterium]
MSFSTNVKEDILKINNVDTKSLKLTLEAMLRFAGEIVISNPLKLTFSSNSLNIVTYLVKNLKKLYDFEYEIEQRKIERFDNSITYRVLIIGANKIIEEMELTKDQTLSKEDIFEDEEYLISYLRGAFLARGSVNDPKSKNGHFEISSTNQSEILFIQRIMNSFELNARVTKRKTYTVCYIKSREAIGDLLYRLGATSTMNYYQDVLITKEIATNAKRSVNLDIANQDKTNASAHEQLKYIKYLEYNYPLQELDSKLLMVMKVRKDHPEHSLTQLLDIIHDEYDPKLTKSGLNHRFRKLKEIALEHAKKD